MCGIYASIGFQPDRARITLVAHRGPDGEGWREYPTAAGPLALGHRRLAIIDTSADGEQPFSDPEGRFHLTYNGEIYNYRELRAEIAATGRVFRTATDIEVLLAAWQLWGEAALERFVGMFAFALYDAREQRLIAARDRYGIKPLYLVETGEGVAFASEIKQLIGLGGAGRAINPARVGDFLFEGISDHTAETMFAGIRQVRGGEIVRIDLSQARPVLTLDRWVGMDRPAPVLLAPAEAAARFRALLEDSVRLHLRSDVTVGSCLSGGLDSSSIVMLMARHLGEEPGAGEIRTVTACYPEKVADERPFAEQVVAASGARAHFVYPKPEDLFAEVRRIIWHQDEPFGSTSIFAQWSVFAEAGRQRIKVMLDGQGADEQLAGYHGLFGLRMRQLAASGRFCAMARTQWQRHRWHGAPLLPPRGQIRALFAGHRDAIFQAPDWIGREAASTFAGRVPASGLAASTIGVAQPDSIEAMCNLLVQSLNLPMLLHWEDRNSMAHGVEARVPFLDHRLVAFSLGLGADHKFDGADTKKVLREAMRGVLPESVRQRRDKLGFATPEEIWMKGPLRGAMIEGIDRTLEQFPGLFEAETLRAHARAVLDGARPFSFQLWRIVCLGLWGERFGVRF